MCVFVLPKTPTPDISIQLDACDPGRHFSTDAVQRATHSPLLLYACLAVSACHLSRTTNSISPDVAHAYHDRCISIMLPVLDKPESDIGIDILLPSTVILRFFESISSTRASTLIFLLFLAFPPSK
jgi:hypothetical protein